MDGCKVCKMGNLCSTGERLLSMVDALDRKRGKMPLEYRTHDRKKTDLD